MKIRDLIEKFDLIKYVENLIIEFSNKLIKNFEKFLLDFKKNEEKYILKLKNFLICFQYLEIPRKGIFHYYNFISFK